jgi:hypothetical protein
MNYTIPSAIIAVLLAVIAAAILFWCFVVALEKWLAHVEKKEVEKHIDDDYMKLKTLIQRSDAGDLWATEKLFDISRKLREATKLLDGDHT